MTKSDTTQRLKLQIAYVGTAFQGWQLQSGGARTVQGCVEQALQRLAGCSVRIHGAGRTDAGVHSIGQIAHADVPATRSNLPWQRALNALLPPDIAIVGCKPVSDAFHARFDAVQKTYTYTLWHEPNWLLPQRSAYVWPVGRLDLEAMEQAAGRLIGRRDWSAFQNQGTPVRSPVRTVVDIHTRIGAHCQETVWHISADGFLKQMVRNLMSCLVMVGRGRLNTEKVLEILDSGRRGSAPATAPARGLCLERVDYDFGSGGES